MKLHPECDTCTCGKILVEWSDRSCFIDPSNHEEIVHATMSCVLDHSYDRTSTGVPDGMPGLIEEKLTPTIAAFVSVIEPDWKNKTLYFDDEQKVALKEILLASLLKG